MIYSTPPWKVGARPRSKTIETEKAIFYFFAWQLTWIWYHLFWLGDFWVLSLKKCDNPKILTLTSYKGMFGQSNIFLNSDLRHKPCSLVIIWTPDLPVNDVYWMFNATTRFLRTPDFPLVLRQDILSESAFSKTNIGLPSIFHMPPWWVMHQVMGHSGSLDPSMGVVDIGANYREMKIGHSTSNRWICYFYFI